MGKLSVGCSGEFVIEFMLSCFLRYFCLHLKHGEQITLGNFLKLSKRNSILQQNGLDGEENEI